MRGIVKEQHPEYTLGDIAKELGRRWGECDEVTKANYASMAEKDKARYERVIFYINSKSLVFSIFINFSLCNFFLKDMNAYKKMKSG